MSKDKPKSKPFHTSTATLMRQMDMEKNVVTRAVLRQIIGNRIDRAHELLNEEK